MASTNRDESVQDRVIKVLTALIDYANGDYGREFPLDRPLPIVKIYWKQIGNRIFLLVVRATSQQIAELVHPELFPSRRRGNQNSEQIKKISDINAAVQFLADKLPEFQDMNPEGEGRSSQWDFTIEMYHQSTETYIKELRDDWPLRGQKFPPRKRTSTQIPSNLPNRNHTKLIGRDGEIAEIYRWLAAADGMPHIIYIEGMGGIGKSALALEVAHQCRDASENPGKFPKIPVFEAIVFFSVSNRQVVGKDVISSHRDRYNLNDLLRTIAKILTGIEELPMDNNDRLARVYDLLDLQRTLLIIDNIETQEEQQEWIGFLKDLPSKVKTIVTSREKQGEGQTITIAESYSEKKTLVLSRLKDESLGQFIEHHQKQRNLELTPQQINNIAEKTEGSPLAIVFILSTIFAGNLSVDNLLQKFAKSTLPINEFCFGMLVDILEREDDDRLYQSLLTLALFDNSIALSALANIANLSPADTNQVIQRLTALYLLSPPANLRLKKVHSLLQYYLRDRLSNSPEREKQLRDRWISYYHKSLEPYQDLYWIEWHDYSTITNDWPNVRAVVNWSMENDRYKDVVKFWQVLKGFTMVGGYWQESQAWLDWLLVESYSRQDSVVYSEALFHTAKTIVFRDDIDPDGEALTLLTESLEIGQNNLSQWQFEVTSFIAAIWINRLRGDRTNSENISQAKSWLENSERIASTGQNHDRFDLYHQCQLLYYQGKLSHCLGDYSVAIDNYKQALDIAQKINYQRGIAYSRGGMATTLLETGSWESAKEEFLGILAMPSMANERRTMAFCYSFLATIFQQTKNLSEAARYGSQAEEIFTSLGMKRQATAIGSRPDSYP
jgi:LuxR family glucitol operon transcriptional activator